MKKRVFIAMVVLVVVAMLTTVIFAAEESRRQKASRADRSGERQRTIQKRFDRLAQQMQLTKEEEGAVMPKIKALIVLKLTGMPKLRELRALQRDQSATDEQISAALRKFRSDLAKVQDKIAKAEKELMDMPEITPRRELILTSLGVLDNGTGLSPVITGRVTASEEGRASQPKKVEGGSAKTQEK